MKNLLTRAALVRLVLAGFILFGGALPAQEAGGGAKGEEINFGEVETTWPGIRYRVIHLERISPDRLLVGVRILAGPKAPAAGTLIGFKPTVPVNVTREQARILGQQVRPFSLARSQMIDETTERTYAALPPAALRKSTLLRTEVLDTLRPGRSITLSVQFPVPPILPGAADVKQFVTFVFPEAASPLRRVALPPPGSLN